MTGPKGSPTPPSNSHSQKKNKKQLQFRITKRKNKERKVLTGSTMRREVYISNNGGFRKEIENEN